MREPEILTNDDVTRMVEAGLSAPTIITKIVTTTSRFDVKVDTLIELAEAGIPPTVIDAMMDQSS